MTTREEREGDDSYEDSNDVAPIPTTPVDDSYVTTETDARLPVQKDGVDYDDPVQPPYSNSDEQLADDENEAIDKANMLPGDRLRHARPRGNYSEGANEDELPQAVREGNLGRSATLKAVE
ncbi:hypothetical protein BGW36DRAFT_351353 [Talaromyces proteolyticus]|uniref:Histone chaperone domain-containing protein n=1 Tax=Talaromyces proteolyticus TaxID=1131652 RepID=A0AAD4KKD2_9EURO|nr:uncharacterized protein BGW36DRAFT_351353 [Talaromyces proteolyticus]KAH8690214.1 hypothetical protein BGW36DRAFT_351353 [Talaromyces proteolyticus]